MPKVSRKRWEEADRIQLVLDVLNGEYDYDRMMEDAREREDPISPAELPPEYIFIEAADVLRRMLTNWVEEWWKERSRRPAAEEDPDDYADEYLDRHKGLQQAFKRIASRLGIRESVFRALLVFQKDSKELSLLVRVFRWMLEDREFEYAGKVFTSRAGFSFSDDPIGAAQGEAMRLFLALLRSRLKASVCRCHLKGCGRWFVNLSGRRLYCSRQHAQEPANGRLQARRNEKTEEKLRHAQEWIRKWKPAHGPWKPWVARKTKLTANFLMLWMGRRKLRPPRTSAPA